MSIPASGLRKRRTHLFVQIPSNTIRDKRLSFRARGLLAYLLDMPDGWDVKSEFLATQGKEGREAVRTALHELGKHGYYRLERRQLLNGTFGMGTAISEEPVDQWAADYAEYDGSAVPCQQQQDGAFKVRHKDGSLSDDGFETAVDPNRGPDDDGGPTGTTGDGFSGPGFPGAGSPDAGSPDSGSPVALREKDTLDTHGNLFLSETAVAVSDEADESDESKDDKNDREDVQRVCEHLRKRIIENDYKPVPSITKEWRRSARLLMDKDGRTEQQVHNMIEWATNDDFWRPNIRSMQKLREHYEKMRERALQDARKAETAAATPRRGDIDWSAAEAKAQQMSQMLGFGATGVGA